MTAKKGLDLQYFSTSALPEHERREAWLYRDWPSIAPAYRSTPTEAFDVTSERLRLDDLVVQYVSISGQQWVRDRSMLHSFDADALAVAITLQGDLHGVFEGRSVRAGPGTMQVVDMAQTSSHQSSASKTIHLLVPRNLALRRGLDVARLHGAVLSSTAAGLLSAHLLSIREAAAELPPDSGKMLARGVLDLLGMAVAASGRPAPIGTDGKDGLAAAARAVIDRELGSTGLNATRLCQLLGISRSTLHRLFEVDGGVQAYVRSRRLEAVRSALADGGANEPLHLLAERFGFSDSAHLSRLFRSRFEMTPTEFRGRIRNEQPHKRP